MRNSVLFLIFISISSYAQNSWEHGRLQVTTDGHYLEYADGKPFFWLGDTGWELFHRLKPDEIKTYLENRGQKGFNVIQAVILPEFDGLTSPNQNGDFPLMNNDPERPNEKYFSLIDFVVQIALEKKLFMGLLPTWGDKVFKLWGIGPVIFNVKNAYDYGLFLGKRYKGFPNIIWILGGDRPAMNNTSDFRPIWRAMAAGIKKGTEDNAIVAYHPSGGEYSTSQFLFMENWLDINMIQGGHGSGHDVAIWKLIERDRNIQPSKPTLDDEPNYEDHPVNPWPSWNPANGYYDDYDVRRQTYRSVFAGACGVTYGHHSVWQFLSPRNLPINHPKIMNWQEGIDRPGASQVGFLRRLIESRNAIDRIPDSTIIRKGQGQNAEHIEAFRGADNSYAMIYLPIGKYIIVNTSFIRNKKIVAWWFSPRNSEVKKIGVLENCLSMKFTSPTTGVKNDWVLIFDDPAKGFGAPGK